ncbi:MAG: SUMF1/EgtB/PvdO family nonheme iron enzyme [Rhodobacterales bacterium]|nr:SUMF1/EgtB/PvdO family nonheme iron enzyme [Rhodobacterales bacterium]
MPKGSTYIALGVGAVLVAAGVLFWAKGAGPVPLPEMIRLEATTQSYRPAGEFRQGTRVVDAPVEVFAAPAIEVMVHHVSEADYTRCVADQACLASTSSQSTDLPQTNVSYLDATAYARWLSDRTGAEWRLPTDAEWQRIAGDRALDDAFDAAANGDDPSRRWIASYRREVERSGEADLKPHPFGYFGVNDVGVADVAGNVWEWTESCFQNGTVAADGSVIETRSDYCGVRAVQGKHRGFVIVFVRDARSGGCAAGVPPDYLGFRLVRDAS